MSESACGGANGSSDADDKDLSRPICPNCKKSYSQTTDLTRHMRSCCPSNLVPCPTCDKRYYSETGVKQHHARTHGESISHTVTNCDYCGEEIEVEDCWFEKQEHHFCDRDCSSSWQEKRVEKECDVCSEPFEVIAFRKDTATCCSRECRIEKTRKITGEERYNYSTKEYECVECGGSVERSPSMVHSIDRIFCSDDCYDEHRRTGYTNYYGANWYQQRAKALRRDQHRCQDCGVTSADLPREPDVHHIHPITRYKNSYDEPEWWERANRLENLITLCQSCHGKWEGIPLKPY
ncbi:eukaryotic-like five-Zn-finger DNA-binding protein [Haloferax tailed virus 1]|uniref:Eukaryotic-like five-Zn-finger DNA-binding protein n=1 Tax=Haloferax tailed virus 1 TaxID=2507575 RepID=A0A410N6W2_HFTV1|nr:HNH endonuclease [Haloferax tailed virus 1]QAS68872.1 eukaryotic-like five-Zn-finger DNA-binding protein [Haloferax tailed virus 1]